MPRYSSDEIVHDFVAFLMGANDRPNPYHCEHDGHLIDREGIINAVRVHLGEEAARTVKITLH